MHYLYRITNITDNKIYIGQSNNPDYRWKQHKYDSNRANPIQYIHRSIAKYGIENFIFEIIATCQTQEDANEIESILIIQHNSRNQNFGYNLMVGGSYGGHSEETKQKISEATIKQIETKGHPAQGTKRTPEQIQTLIQARKDNPVDYTPEVRKNMSKAHIGIKDTEETKQSKSLSATIAWEERKDQIIASGELKCNAPGCVVETPRYYIVNDIRYCSKHGQKLKRTGSL